jgi:hypothetical protein
MERCGWAKGELYVSYHDTEWGVPVHDDRRLFEFLILEGAQAGLSWITILKKREAYREAFDHFDPARVARYGAKKVSALLADPGIVRNRTRSYGRDASLAPTLYGSRGCRCRAAITGNHLAFKCQGKRRGETRAAVRAGAPGGHRPPPAGRKRDQPF